MTKNICLPLKFVIFVITFLSLTYSQPTLASSKKIIAVGDINNPPLSFLNKEGKPDGYCVDLFKNIAQELKVDYELVLKPLHNALEDVRKGNADIIIGMHYTNYHKEMFFNFSELYTTVNFFVQRNAPYKSLNDLKGKSILVKKGSICDFFLKKNHFTDKIIEVDNPIKALKLIEKGKYDAYYGCNTVTTYLLEKEFGIKDIYNNQFFRKIKSSEGSIEYGIAGLMTNEILMKELNQAYLNIYEGNKGFDIYKKWFTPENPEVNLKKFYWIIGGGALLLLFAFFTNLYSRRQVIRATKKLNEKDAFLKKILNNMPLSVAVFNPQENNYIFLNEDQFDSSHRTKSIPTSEILNSVTEKEILRFKQENAQVLRTKKSIIKEEALELKNGTIHNNMTSRIYIEHEGKKYILITRSNIEELLKAKKDAEKANKLKTDFLANVSHDIRNPINAIVGFSELLISTNNEKDKAEYMTIIQHNNELLQEMFKSLLDFARIESGNIKLEKAKFDIAQNIHQTIITFRHQNKNKKVQLLEDNPYSSCIINEDKYRINQIINNFITNAMKFTPKGYIKLGYQYEENGIRIYVEDTGIGISEENKEKVFNRFFKAHEGINGTGLGISICKGIIKMMNGKIGLTSKKGEGSCFWIWWPCQAEYVLKEMNTNSEKEA